MNGKTFMQGAVILAAAGIVIKALGAAFRIPLGNMISDRGMGYYQTAYTIYVMFLVLSNSGIPVALSRMVSERVAVGETEAARRVFRVSFILLACIGVASAYICLFQTELMLNMFPNMEKSADAIRAIAPALLIVPLMAAYRGYFQGMQNMRPTAKSQIAEQFFRVMTGLGLAWLLLPRGEHMAAAGAAFGATAGAAAGIVTVVVIYLRAARAERDRDAERAVCGSGDAASRDGEAHGSSGAGAPESARRILLNIFAIAVPITIGAAIMPIMNFLDLAIITNRLAELGWTAEEVTENYGRLTGFANPLINLPQILTQAVAMSLVPAVAAAHKRGDLEFMRHNIRLGLRTSLVVGLPCALGIMTLAKPVMLMFFPAEREAASVAASLLFILAFGIIFLSAVQTLTGVLQGIGRQMIPVRNLFIGAAAKIAVTWTLIAIPAVNVKGAAAGTVTAYVVAATLNLLAVRRAAGVRFDVRLTFLKPLASAVVMAVIVGGSYAGLHRLCGDSWLGIATATLLSVAVGVCVYAVTILAVGAVKTEELELLPRGATLAALLRSRGVTDFLKRKRQRY